MKKISILLLVLVAALASCKKTPEVNLKYVDIERDLVTVGSTTANIQCDYDYITTLKKAFIYYGVGEDEENMTSAEMRVVQASLYVELTGLSENTTYGYYYEFVNGFNSMRSEVKTFKTESMPVPPPEITLPTVITSAVTDITTNSATCGGEITSDGGAEVTERGICWSTNENPTLSDAHITVDSALLMFTITMADLEENTTYHVRAFATNAAGTGYGEDKVFTTLSGGGNGNHDYVDLGLPSGTLWATCNVGANSPEEYGDYYAWGEVLTKQFYGWITYQHCYNGDFQQLTKYCTNPSYGYQGFTDNLTVLQQEDDVASVAWGGDWCIPSRAQWQELLENTTNTKVTQNGVVGRRFTASNGNSLFLPAAGEFNNGTVVDCGWYLSNTLSLTYNYNNSAWGLYFSLAWDSNHCYMASNMTRCFGHSIRPVRVSSDPPVLPVELPDVGIINIIDITSTSVSCESVVVDDGGAVVTDRGLCCSTSLNPTLNDIHMSSGSGAGYFTTIVNGLTPNTNYYVCAYATNEVGTSYSVVIPFTTLQLK